MNTPHDSCFSIESPTMKVDKIYLPRENMSLPSNMQLNDLSTLHKGKTLLLRDRYLIRTEAELSSMVQSNYRTGNRVAILVPWALASVPVVFSMTLSHLLLYFLIPMWSLCSTRDRQTPPWGEDERGRGGSVCCLRCQG